MRVKRFVANSMQEAIALVKDDFGPEAVILHTKRTRRGGLLRLFGKPKVEVIAATDSPAKRPNQGRPVARLQDVKQAARQGIQEDHTTVSELAMVRQELAQIKQALQAQSGKSGPIFSPGFDEVRKILEEQEVQQDLIYELLTAVEDRASTAQSEDPDWIKKEVHHEIMTGVACVDPLSLNEVAKVQCLIGPTGVGKTTTIAKLAANYSLLGAKKVALITVDTYRIAAVEQLKTYAEIIDVPVDVAFTAQELKEALRRRQQYDLILVDTAGRSQKNKMQMAELRAFLEVLESPHVHLVLSATTRLNDMLSLVEHFGSLPISHMIVTKIDETSTYGMIYNLSRLAGLPLSYITNGQSVPDDIEVAEAERIADMILGVKG